MQLASELETVRELLALEIDGFAPRRLGADDEVTVQSECADVGRSCARVGTPLHHP